VLAVHGDRAGDAERDLGDAGEQLAVALGEVRVERLRVDVPRARARELLDEGAARGDRLVGVVVLASRGTSRAGRPAR
jgi:hypothetical protein